MSNYPPLLPPLQDFEVSATHSAIIRARTQEEAIRKYREEDYLESSFVIEATPLFFPPEEEI